MSSGIGSNAVHFAHRPSESYARPSPCPYAISPRSSCKGTDALSCREQLAGVVGAGLDAAEAFDEHAAKAMRKKHTVAQRAHGAPEVAMHRVNEQPGVDGEWTVIADQNARPLRNALGMVKLRADHARERICAHAGVERGEIEAEVVWKTYRIHDGGRDPT
jgi:hypothetical protein